MQVAAEYTLRIVLPEGASDIKVHAPFPLDSHSVESRFSLLDTVGRPGVQ